MTGLIEPVQLKPLRSSMRLHPLCATYVDPLDGGDILVKSIEQMYESHGSSIEIWQANSPPRHPKGNHPIVVVEDFESLIDNRRWCTMLGSLRVSIHQALENGTRVLLVTTVAPSRLAGCPGSSVLIDAKHVDLRATIGPPLPEAVSALELPGFGKSLVLSTGLIGLITCFGVPGVKPHVAIDALVRRCARLLGEDHGAELLQELRVATRLGRFDEDNTTTDVRGSGIYRLAAWLVNDANEATRKLRESLRDSVAETVGACVSPPADLGSSFEHLFEIERQLRKLIVEACVRQSQRLSDCLSAEHRERVAERSRRSRCPVPPWNPSEWLTTEELVEVLTMNVWMLDRHQDLAQRLDDLRREVIPVRNSIAHFRSSTPRERETLRQWRAELADLLKESDAAGAP